MPVSTLHLSKLQTGQTTTTSYGKTGSNSMSCIVLKLINVLQVALKRQQAVEEQCGDFIGPTPPAFDRSLKPSGLPFSSQTSRPMARTENKTSKYDHFGLMKKLFPNQTDSVII